MNTKSQHQQLPQIHRIKRNLDYKLMHLSNHKNTKQKISVSPSPLKKKISAPKQQKIIRSSIQTNVQEQKSYKQSKIMISQQQLIEFTKKFAIQKADLEDKMDILWDEKQKVRSMITVLQQEIVKLKSICKEKQIQQQKLKKELSIYEQKNGTLIKKLSQYKIDIEERKQQNKQLLNQLNYYKQNFQQFKKLDQQRTDKLLAQISTLRQLNQNQTRIINQQNIQFYKHLDIQLNQIPNRQQILLQQKIKTISNPLQRLKMRKVAQKQIKKIQYESKINALQNEVRKLEEQKNEIKNKNEEFKKIQTELKMKLNLMSNRLNKQIQSKLKFNQLKSIKQQKFEQQDKNLNFQLIQLKSKLNSIQKLNYIYPKTQLNTQITHNYQDQSSIELVINETNTLDNQLNHYKEERKLSNKKHSNDQNINVSNLKESPIKNKYQLTNQNKKTKIMAFLKNIANFSKELSFRNQQNPLDIELCSIIVNRLTDHIENLQKSLKLYSKEHTQLSQ